MFAKIKTFLLKNEGTNQILAKNTFWLAFGEVTSRLLKLSIIFYAIRILGVSDWGSFSYAISLCSLFMIFSDIGLSSILTRELSKNADKKYIYISTSFTIKLILNISLFIIMIYFAPIFSKNIISTNIIPIIALLLVFDSIREFTFSINRSMEKMETEAFIKIITNLLIIIITYIFLLNSRTVISLAAGYLLGSFIGTIISLIFFKKYFNKNIFKNFSKPLIKPLLTIAWPFAFFAILGSIMANTDIVMLGLIKDSTEVGYYAASQRIVAFLIIIPGLITSSILPTLAKQINDKEKIKNVLHSSIKIIYILSIPIVMGGLIISSDFILKLFGSEYTPAIPMFKISLLSILFIFPALIFNSIIFIFDKHKSIIKISLIGTILNVLINILLIPKYGGVGSSIATLVSEIVIMLLIKKQLETIIKINIFNNLSKIIIGSVIMSLILLIMKYLNANLYVCIIISIFVYFMILIIIKEESLYKIKNIIFKK